MGFAFLEAGRRARLPFAGGDLFVMLALYEEPQARCRICRRALRINLVEALKVG